MKKFILKTIILFIIFLIMNVLLFQWLAKPILYEGYVHHKKYDIGKYSKVMFSDSRGESLLQSDLDNIGIYNFSLGSDNYQDILFRIIYLHSHYPHVDTLLLGLDKHMFSRYRESLNNNNRSVFYLDNVHKSRYIPYSQLEILFRKAYFFLPFLDFQNAELYYLALKSKINALFSLPPPVTPARKWSQSDSLEQFKLTQGRIRMQFPDTIKSQLLEKQLYLIIDYCKENKLTLIGIAFPLTGHYLRLQEQIKYNPMDVFKNEGFSIVDFSKSMIGQDSLFLNTDHLNDAGSEPFCKMLKEKLREFKGESQGCKSKAYHLPKG